MKTILRFLGPITIIIGVIILAVYFFTQSSSNNYLIAAGGVLVLGLILHIVLNRVLK